MRFARFLSRRSAPERLAIACLRGSISHAHVVGDARDIQAAFAKLVTLLQRRGVVIFPQESPFVSDGEIEVLAKLAAIQHHHGPASVLVDDAEGAALLRCAVILVNAGLLLSHGGALRAGHGNNRTGAGDQSGRLTDHDMVRARAISLVRLRQIASTSEFAAVGVSRQYVSRLCKDGYLQRVRYGWYRATPAEGGRSPAPGTRATALHHHQ